MRKIINLNNRITVNPRVRFGKPCIKGTRIAIEDILNLFKAGYTLQEILKQCPAAEKKDIIAALEYMASIVGKEELYSLSLVK